MHFIENWHNREHKIYEAAGLRTGKILPATFFSFERKNEYKISSSFSEKNGSFLCK
jgi:hypothetical protein